MEEKTFLIEGDSALVRTFTKSYEWYTPVRYIRAVTSALGGIDMELHPLLRIANFPKRLTHTGIQK